MAKWGKCIGCSFIALLVLYVTFCGIVYFKPQWFFYNPQPVTISLETAHQDGYPAAQVEYKSADGTNLYAWYTEPAPRFRKVIVFLHGNSHNIGFFYKKLIPFVQAGYGTLLPEYRGFGNIPGDITEQNLAADAIAAIDYLHSLGFYNRQIYIYGMSLGSYMATNAIYTLGQEQHFGGLILEVPFDRLDNVVRRHVDVPLPINWLVRDKFINTEKIKEIHTPLLIMAGGEDTLVPADLATALYNQAPEPKKMFLYSRAGHNGLYDYSNYRDILNWLGANEEARR